MIGTLVRSVLPDRPIPMTVWRGPFRGARIVANPRASLRKVLGVYEHELNGWLMQALPRSRRLIDVGANDGYFAFGAAAALRREGRAAEIICIEPQAEHVAQLRNAAAMQPPPRPALTIIEALVGDRETEGSRTLDSLPVADHDDTLIKIDVEGAELAVIAGAQSWLRPSNCFVIEVHSADYIAPLMTIFATHGLQLRQIDQRPLPVFGRELRDADNRWLVSHL